MTSANCLYQVFPNKDHNPKQKGLSRHPYTQYSPFAKIKSGQLGAEFSKWLTMYTEQETRQMGLCREMEHQDVHVGAWYYHSLTL